MVPQGFQPTLDQATVQNYIKLYQQKPEGISDEELKMLENHAEFYHIPFAEDEGAHQGRISGLIGQLGAGFGSGFSTFNMGRAPKDEWESIARNVGHLAGFVGFVPIPMKIARMSKLAMGLKKLQGKSVPMLAANLLTKKVSKIASSTLAKGVTARAGATGTATEFLQKGVVQDLAKGAFHLGVASSVGAWQGGVDEMMRAFIGGAETGAVFRGIGNIVQTGSKVGDKVLRGLSSSLYTGLHSTMQGATTPEQVYEYLLGAYFGVKEMPYHRRQGFGHINKMFKKGTRDPEIVKGWEELDGKTQNFIKEEVSHIRGKTEQVSALAYKLSEYSGIPIEEAQVKAKEIIDRIPKYSKYGEEISPLSEKLLEKDEAFELIMRQDKEPKGDHSRDEADVGNPVLEDLVFTKKTEGWVQRNMEGKWETEGERAQTTLDVENQWDALSAEGRKTKKNPSQEMVDWLQKKYEISLDEKNVNWWRQRGERLIKARRVPMLTVRDGEMREILAGDDRNDVGNEKLLLEEPKLVDEVYGTAADREGLVPAEPGGEKTYKGTVRTLAPNQIFVFGSNEGSSKGGKPTHGRGSALHAKQKFGAVQGQPRGLQGKSYGIVTKKHYDVPKSSSPEEIKSEIKELYNFAEENPNKEFIIPYGIGKGLSGYAPKEMAKFFREAGDIPNNITFKSGFNELVRAGGVAKGKHSYTILDHAVEMTENGYREVDLLDLEETYYRRVEPEHLNASLSGEGPKDYRKAARKAASNMVKDFHSKNFMVMDSKGFYYYGGKGDAQRQYFLKYHPNIKKTPLAAKKQLSDIRKEFIKHGIKATEFDKAFNKDMAEWVSEMRQIDPKVAEEMFKKAYVSNTLYELEMNGFSPEFKNLESTLKDGFINSAGAFNKRQQIWFTSGFSSTPDLIKEKISDVTADGKYKVYVVEDDNAKQWPLWSDGAILGREDVINAQNTDWGLPTEGNVSKSFIVSRMTDDVGNPQGALLGKYMAHAGSAPVEQLLRDKNAHFIINKSSAKQWGLLKPGKLKWTADKNNPDGGTVRVTGKEIYIPVEDFKGVLSEKTDSKSLEWQRLPKQMLSNLTPFAHKDIKPEVIEDFYNSLSREAFGGQEEANKTLRTYLKNPEGNKSMLPDIIKNMDSIGISELLRGIKQGNAVAFSNAAYAKIQKVNRTIMEEMVSEGDMTNKEYKDSMTEASEQLNVHERIMKFSEDSLLGVLHKFNHDYRMQAIRNYVVHRITRPEVGNSFSARMRPFDIGLRGERQDDPEGLYQTHRLKRNKNLFFLDDGYKNLLLRSEHWKGTRTLFDVFKEYQSSGLDPVMRDKSAINVADLMFKRWTKAKKTDTAVFTEMDIPVRGNVSGAVHLDKIISAGGIVGKKGEKGAYKVEKIVGDKYRISKITKPPVPKIGFKGIRPQIEELLRGVIVRVPMDSMSGARGIRFGGFTKVGGYGILLRQEAMDALGGADLDGDKAFGFFGGGAGNGFKKSWKDMYSNQVNEFGGESSNAVKAAFRDRFTETPILTPAQEKKKERAEKVLQYSPQRRQFFSNAATSGRAILGPAVVTRSVLGAAYAAARASKKGYVETETVLYDKNRNPFDAIIRMVPRTKPEDIKLFNRKARAIVSFASDPMDEAGLKSRDIIFDELANTAFKWEVFSVNKDGKRTYLRKKSAEMNTDKQYKYKLTHHLRRKGLAQMLGGVNTALYGRNLTEGRRWTFDEIKSRVDAVTDPVMGLSENMRNTLIPKLAADMKGIDWTDNIFARIDKERLRDLYGRHEDNLGAFKWLRDLLGRSTMRVKEGAYIDLVFNKKLWEESSLRKLLDPKIEDPLKHPDFAAYNKLSIKEGDKEYYNPKDMVQRERFLRDILRKAEDYIINDMSDMVSSARIADIARGLPEATIEEISEVADNLKRFSYLQARRRAKVLDPTKEDLTDAEREFVEYMERAGADKPFSSLIDQNTINLKINQMKWEHETNALGQVRFIKDPKNGKYVPKMTAQEADLLDAMLLGSMNRGRHEELAKIEEAWKKVRKTGNIPKSWKLKQQVENLRKKVDSTSVNRLGFASKAVSDRSVKGFVEDFKTLFNYTTSIPSEATQKRVKEEAAMAGRRVPLIDEEGNRVHGSVFEASDYDQRTQKYLDEYAPFVGLKDAPLKGEALKVYLSLKEHLDHYHNDIGRDLNGFVRSILGRQGRPGKDINEMDLEDFRVLDRWFKDARGGTWYQKLFRPVDVKKGPAISGWFYNMFPEAIGRDLLRYELNLMDERRPYKDKYGNIIEGKVRTPVSFMEKLMNVSHKAQEQSTQAFEEEKKLLDADLDPYLKGIEEADALYDIAIRRHEMNMMKVLKDQYAGTGVYTYYKSVYDNNLRKSKKETDWKNLKHKEFLVMLPGKDGVPVGKKMTGREIANDVSKIVEKWNEKIHRWLTGDKEIINEYIKIDDGSLHGLIKLRKRFMADLEKSWKYGKRFDIGVGIDGMRKIAKRIAMSQLPKELRKDVPMLRENLEIQDTQQLPFNAYYPHKALDRKSASEAIKRALDLVNNDGSMTEKDRIDEVKKLSFHHRQLTGDWLSVDPMEDTYKHLDTAHREIAEGKKESEKGIRWFHANQRVGSQHSRSAHIPGWRVAPEIYESYMKDVLDTYYRLVAQVASKTAITDFMYKNLKKYSNPDMTLAWVDFYNLYVQGAMGYPSKIPPRVMNNPLMKIKGTPYAWFADSTVLKRMNSIAKKFGLRQDERLPEELKGFDAGQLAAWGNLEAKYQLASLLMHPKFSIANLYGGSVHTLVSTGFDNFKNSHKFGYLKRHLNPNWESMKDVDSWVHSHGVIEEFMRYEADINPQLKSHRWQKFIKEASGKIRKDPELEDVSLLSIAKKHGITESMLDKAAIFMRKPERLLRRSAFVSHYLQAKDHFGAAYKFDHPHLVEFAKKGVKGTQFLYSAPHRPMFAATTTGKVMTRFQLWAWNSVRFRNQVLRNAEIYGWREGSQEFERYKRLAVADLMMLSLGSVFMYSLFENALPAPYNWFQDFADLMFGDDKERERAFFGSYPYPLQPLQMVTPPALRILPPLFKGIVTDDYSKLSGYYIWSMFPGGRFARDIKGSIENPSRLVEKMTGLPYQQFSRELSKEKKKEKLRPKGLLS
jgi:hypothetical protein